MAEGKNPKSRSVLKKHLLELGVAGVFLVVGWIVSDYEKGSKGFIGSIIGYIGFTLFIIAIFKALIAVNAHTSTPTQRIFRIFFNTIFFLAILCVILFYLLSVFFVLGFRGGPDYVSQKTRTHRL